MNATGFGRWDERDLLELLSIDEIAPGRFRSRFGQVNEHGRTYGGQLMGQATVAAARTAPAGRALTMMQFLFLQGADPDRPIDFEVTPLQEGKRFASRNARGSQAGGRIVCDAQFTFAAALAAPSHRAAPPDGFFAMDPDASPKLSQMPSALAHEVERVLAYRVADVGFLDMRARGVGDIALTPSDEPRMGFWIKARQTLPDDAATHAAVFAYLSDWWINYVSCGAFVPDMIGEGRGLYVASLNHAIWRHRAFRADQWLYFDCASPSAGEGRGLAIARVFDRQGTLVASATQECLIAYAD